jgi:hypothetical protein
LGKNNHQEIKILDLKKIDYTYTCKDDLFDIKSSSYSDEKNIDSSSRSNKEKKDVKRKRHDITKNTKIRARGRIAGGQSKQSHSSVYE